MTQAKETREKGELRKLPMMPIRDMVIFPYMMTPFVVGRESSVRALEEALTGDRKIFLATQHDASDRRAQGQGHLPGGHDLQYRAEREDARRQYQGAGGGRGAGQVDRGERRATDFLWPRCAPARRSLR